MCVYIYMVPRPGCTSPKDGEFGLPIYLSVGFLAHILDDASNAALTAQSSHLLCHKPNPNSLWFTLPLFFFSLLIFHTSLRLLTPIPFILSFLLYSPLSGKPNHYFCVNSHAIPLLPRIPKKLIPSKDSLETSTWHRIVIGNGFPQGTNCARGIDLGPNYSLIGYPWPTSRCWA